MLTFPNFSEYEQRERDEVAHRREKRLLDALSKPLLCPICGEVIPVRFPIGSHPLVCADEFGYHEEDKRWTDWGILPVRLWWPRRQRGEETPDAE